MLMQGIHGRSCCRYSLRSLSPRRDLKVTTHCSEPNFGRSRDAAGDTEQTDSEGQGLGLAVWKMGTKI